MTYKICFIGFAEIDFLVLFSATDIFRMLDVLDVAAPPLPLLLSNFRVRLKHVSLVSFDPSPSTAARQSAASRIV